MGIACRGSQGVTQCLKTIRPQPHPNCSVEWPALAAPVAVSLRAAESRCLNPRWQRCYATRIDFAFSPYAFMPRFRYSGLPALLQFVLLIYDDYTSHDRERGGIDRDRRNGDCPANAGSLISSADRESIYRVCWDLAGFAPQIRH